MMTTTPDFKAFEANMRRARRAAWRELFLDALPAILAVVAAVFSDGGYLEEALSCQHSRTA